MLIRSTFKRGKIGQSFKGLAYSYTSKHGEVYASMPKKPGKARTSLQQQNMDMFKDACIAMKLLPAPFLNAAREAAKDTPMLPRDCILAALYGQGPVFFLPGGRRLIPMARRVDMSSVMDNLAWKPGSLLWRDNDLWVGLDRPDVPSLLGFDMVNGPVWLDAENFGSSRLWQAPIPGLIVTNNFNCKGAFYSPFEHIITYQMSFWHEIQSGKTPWISVYRLTVGNVIEQILADETTGVTVTGAAGFITHAFSAPFVMEPGARYVFCVRVPTDADAASTRVNVATRTQPVLPIIPQWGRYGCAKANPVVGDVFTSLATTETYSIGFQGRT